MIETQDGDTIKMTVLYEKRDSTKGDLPQFLRLFMEKIKKNIKETARYSENYTVSLKCFDKNDVFKWEYKESFAWEDLWKK